jgi:hypothetical protein
VAPEPAEAPEELVRAVADRLHWTIQGDVALYAPPAGWLVRVRCVYQAARAAERWHAALIVNGVAKRTAVEYSAAAAVGWAERIRP